MKKKIVNTFKKYLAPVSLFIVWLIVTIPNLKIYWMLIDDGASVVFARTLFEKISGFDILGFLSQLFENVGRFRPVYWLYHMWVWLIGGNSYQFHHFAHMVVIGVAVFFVYLIILELTKSKTISFIASLFYFFIPLNTENIVRLGPQEPLVSMFFAIFFYFVIKEKKTLLSYLMIVLAIFTKETALALLPALFFYYIYQRRNTSKKTSKASLKYLITIGVSSIIMVLITLLRRGGYNSNYSFDIQLIIQNLFIYFKELSIGMSGLFSLVLGIYVVRTLYKLIKKKKLFETKIDLFEFIFLGGFLCFLTIQLPWAYALTRYLMPTILFLTLFMFLEIYQIVQLLGKVKSISIHKKTVVVLSFVAAFYTLSLWGLDVVLKERSSISTENVFQKMAETPKDTVVLMNMKDGDSTIELVYETQIILNELFDRTDIKSGYLDLKNLPKGKYIIIDSPQFPRKYSKEELTKVFGKEYFSSEKTSDRLVLTTPLELIKQSIKKGIGKVLHKEKFSPEGLYTYYHSSSNWYFFNEK